MKYCNQCHSTYPTDFNTCPKDQCVLATTAELLPGMVLRGKYEIVEKIGSGGMASVYRVHHRHLKEDVAIKVVSNSLAADASFLERFQTEAVVTRKLRHPNAVRLDDFDLTEDGRPFIVMELVGGRSLRSLLQNGWVAPARAAAIARQVALALGAAHELGIVHRDIKPENILLVPQADGTDQVKVLDFGIARVTRETADLAAGHAPTRTGVILGTPQYVSPEQAKGVKGNAMDGRSDLYSLGVVLYEMLTGELPFHADTPFDLLLQHIQTVPQAPHLVNDHAGISGAMSELVMKALEKDPAKRFQTAAQMASALEDPAVAAQAPSQTGAHVFSTAALAAAAAASALVPAPEPAQERPNPEVVRQTVIRTEVVGEPTLPMGSSVRPDLPAAAARPHPPTSRKSRSRRWFVAAAACLALVFGGWVLSAISGHDTANADSTVQTVSERPAVESPRSAASTNRPGTRSSRKPATRANVPEVSNSERARELTAAGYNRLAQHDYAGAHDDFAQALELDPNNASARRGLQLSQGGQAVDTISGILRR